MVVGTVGMESEAKGRSNNDLRRLEVAGTASGGRARWDDHDDFIPIFLTVIGKGSVKKMIERTTKRKKVQRWGWV